MSLLLGVVPIKDCQGKSYNIGSVLSFIDGGRWSVIVRFRHPEPNGFQFRTSASEATDLFRDSSVRP